jgi:glycosyltransferase involved in cell wall biosynthesis
MTIKGYDVIGLVFARNERYGIREVIKDLKEQDVKVKVIDGNSSDGTREIVESLGVEVVTYSGRNGKGGDFLSYIGELKGTPKGNRIFVTHDGDYSYNANIKKLVRHIEEGAEVVIGSRFKDIKPEPGSIRKFNEIGNRFLAYALSKLHRKELQGKKITDCTSGCIVVREDVLRNIELPSIANKFGLEISLITTAINDGRVIEEESIGYRKRKGETKDKLHESWKFPLYLLNCYVTNKLRGSKARHNN